MTKNASTRRQRPDDHSLTFSRIVGDVTASGLTQADLARAVGASVRTVQNWASGTSAPAGVRMKRLLDLQFLVNELREAYTEEGVQIWLHSRNRNLGSERPLDLLFAGNRDEVLREARRVSGAM